MTSTVVKNTSMLAYSSTADIMFERITSQNSHLLEEFFKNCNTSDRYREESFEGILEQVRLDNTFSIYASVKDGVVTSAIIMMELPMQKAQVLDLYLTRKNVSIRESQLGELVEHAVLEGEKKNIYRVISMVTEDYYKKLKALERANKIFLWKQRYDCVVDEIIDPLHFSKYGIIYNYITKQALRKDRVFITHYHLKPEFRYASKTN